MVKLTSNSNNSCRILLILLFCFPIYGCEFIKNLGPHKISIQQGNLITQSMVDKLVPGMTAKQVKYLLGTPLITDTFSADQWNYYYSLRLGSGRVLKKQVTVYFDNNIFTHITGDFEINNKDEDLSL